MRRRYSQKLKSSNLPQLLSGMVFAGAVWTTGMVTGLVVEQVARGSGALTGSVSAISLCVFLLHRWKNALYSSSERVYRKACEGAAMALLAPTDDHPCLPWSEWAYAPDALQRFLAFLRVRNCRTVVECGSGISTILIAREFCALGRGHVWALEHDVAWAKLVREMLAERGLSDWATVVTAPLEPLTSDGMHFNWYSRTSLVEVLALEKIDALLVDGPKGDSGPLARYPAVPVFLKQLGSSFIVVLDDGRRPEEVEIAALWEQNCGVSFTFCHTAQGQWEGFR